MGALPKRKYAKARQGRRRGHLKVASLPHIELCSQCHSPKLPHRVCPTCGTYAGREVIEIKTPRKKAS
ncbi:MAG: 50S ribosomal protein L32 [Dehalococcoidales bacterium]|nr:50S ribosomal protein L32 [Dehalococcoidales bacterium]